MNNKRIPTPRSIGWRALAVALALSAAAAPARAERFLGTLVNLEQGENAPLVIGIDRYSTDEEVRQLKAILAEKGADALSDALWNLERGYIRIGGGLGYPIAVARSRPADGGGRVIRLMLDRPISFREIWRSSRSLDYPFTYIELALGADGTGEGKMYAAASVEIEDGAVEIENYSALPIKLLNVRTE